MNMIILTHHSGEPHGILGAQLAATFLEQKLSLPSMVVGVERGFSKDRLLGFIDEYYQKKEKRIAFSHLCGRKDLIELIRELKRRGFFTLLGGPQAREDYVGEPESHRYPHRFQGLKSTVDIAYQGPVDGLGMEDFTKRRVILEVPWRRSLSIEVNWSNLYLFSDRLRQLQVQTAQVLQAIGCPYASKPQAVTLPPPTSLRERGVKPLPIKSQGCIFCDVSRDKGFHGLLEMDQVIHQIRRLPERDGKKIPFELIDEYPLRSLGMLLQKVNEQNLHLSQIHLVCRVDDINAHAEALPEILSLAKKEEVKILFASIGFESFSDRLLHHFCKGISLSDIVKCVETLRRLKDRFGDQILYRKDEGANHGFIRPTPWDDGETLREMDQTIFLHRFWEDILPEHSTPLIIHHASYLGDWIRQIESTTGITFGREGTWIEWWNPSL